MSLPDDLQNEDRENQLDVMRTWFFENFENPAERTPYESREGGYIWIWGGPYDAQEELSDEFGGVVPDDVIEELSSELNAICYQWAPIAKPGDYDEYLVNNIAEITEYYHNFSGSILDIKKLLEVDIDGSVNHCFYRLLYVNVITTMETYLSDAFINSVVPDAELMRSFIESTPEFKAEKIPLANVYKAAEEIEQRAKKYLADVVWHNLGRIKPMYKSVLGIEFDTKLGPITKEILNRHDIVHRNGKTKSGEEIFITKEGVKVLISMVEAFIKEVDEKLSKMKANRKIEPTAETSVDF
ncbi:hypothetical protein KA005_25540 [bacterium]|nr:hypothetical protein [bacterium]